MSVDERTKEEHTVILASLLRGIQECLQLGRDDGEEPEDLSIAKSRLSVSKTAMSVVQRSLSVSKTALSVVQSRLSVSKITLSVVQSCLSVSKIALSVVQSRLSVSKSWLSALREGLPLSRSRLSTSKPRLFIVRAQLSGFKSLLCVGEATLLNARPAFLVMINFAKAGEPKLTSREARMRTKNSFKVSRELSYAALKP